MDSIKLASKFQSELEKANREKLGILIQLESGDEATKCGLPVDQLDQMIQHIDTNCPRLDLKGFMAMGKLNDREGFISIRQLRDKVCDRRGLDVG